MSTKVATNGPSKHFRRGRAAGANLVPATTGAARATTRALPEHAGRFDGIAVRASIPVGSIADITFVTSRRTSVEEVDERFVDAAQTKRYPGVPGVSRDPLVSPDVVGDPRASIVDLELTKVSDGDLVKVMSWYARGTVGDQRALILQHGPAQRDSIVTGSSGTIGSPPPSSILGKTFDAACGKERVPYPENDPPLNTAHELSRSRCDHGRNDDGKTLRPSHQICPSRRERFGPSPPTAGHSPHTMSAPLPTPTIHRWLRRR